MTNRPTNIFAITLISAGVLFAPQIAQAGGAPSSGTVDPTSGHNIVQMSDAPVPKVTETGGASSSSKLDPTSGYNIVQMNGTVVKRGGVFVETRTGGGKGVGVGIK